MILFKSFLCKGWWFAPNKAIVLADYIHPHIHVCVYVAINIYMYLHLGFLKNLRKELEKLVLQTSKPPREIMKHFYVV